MSQPDRPPPPTVTTAANRDAEEPMTDIDSYITGLAQLAVRQGANVQPGQIVALASEPGKEPLARAIAEAAYAAGAKFVDLSVFDVHLKRARARHADRDSLSFVPPWIGERVLALGEHRAARISLSAWTRWSNSGSWTRGTSRCLRGRSRRRWPGWRRPC